MEKKNKKITAKKKKQGNEIKSLLVRAVLVSTLFAGSKEQNCSETKIDGMGKHLSLKVTSDGNLLTIDTNLILRTLSLDSHQVKKVVDVRTIFMKSGYIENIIQGTVFFSETEMNIFCFNGIYEIDLSKRTVQKIPSALTERDIWISNDKFWDLSTDQVRLIGIRRKNYQSMIISTDLRYEEIYLQRQHYKYISYYKIITGTPTPSKWPQARLYVIDHSNFIGYIYYTGSEKNGDENWIKDSYHEVTSNIAIKDSQDVLAYGVSSKFFQKGGIRFRDLDLVNKFIKELDNPFIYCQFHPSSDVILTHEIEGELCIVSYDLIANSASVTSCHFTTSPEFSIEFVSDTKFIMTRESIIMVYSYPSITLSHVYSPQPIFMNQLPGGKTKQVHVFPGIKLRIFDTHLMEYSDGSLYEGKVLKAYFNPHDEDEIFAQIALEKIVRIKVSDKQILGEYQPITQISEVSPTYRDCKLLAFDLYKIKTNLLMALYRCYKKSDGKRSNYFIEFNYETGTVEFERKRITDDYYNQLRVGVDNNKDVIGIGSMYWLFKFKIYYSPFEVSARIKSSSEAKRPSYNIELSSSYTLFLKLNMNFVLKFPSNDRGTGGSGSSFKSYNPVTNCLPDPIPKNTSTTFTTPEYIACGGVGLYMTRETHFINDEKRKIPLHQISGAIFKGPDGGLYIQHNEKTRTRFNIDKGECYINNFDDDTVELIKDNSCTSGWDCDICPSNRYVSQDCKLCKNGKLAYLGNCIDSPCPAGSYEYPGICREHCPIGYFKLDQSWDKPQCVTNCSNHFPNFYEFADKCLSKCPPGARLVVYECQCPEGLFASEDGSACVSDSCLPSGFKMHHYRMCVSEIRNSSHYQVYNGNDVYCDDRHFLNLTTMRCVKTCTNAITQYHEDYGDVCFSDPSECTDILGYYWDSEKEACILPLCVPPNDILISFNKICVTSCPPEFYFSPDSKTCETKESCNQKGYVYTLLEGYPKTCTSSCPPGLYYYDIYQSCLDLGECKRRKRFTRSDTMECLMDQKCMEASRFPILDTNECITNCPPGTIFVRGYFKCLEPPQEVVANKTNQTQSKTNHTQNKRNKTSYNMQENIERSLLVEKKFNEKKQKPLNKTNFSEWMVNMKVITNLLSHFAPMMEIIITNTNVMNFYCYLAQTNSKLMMTSYHAFLMDEEVDEEYAYVFQDVLGVISESITDKVSEGTVEKDQENVCEKSSDRFCHIGAASNFVSNQSFLFVQVIVVLILVTIFGLLSYKYRYFEIKKNRMGYGVLTSYWVSNQNDLIFSMMFCLTHPYFGTWSLIFGYVFSLVGLVVCYYIAYGIKFKGKWKNSRLFREAVIRHMKEDFNTVNKGAYYIGLNLIYDSLMCLFIFLFQGLPIVQTFLWMISQHAYFLYVFNRVKFRRASIKRRVIVIELLFCILSYFIAYLAAYPRDKNASRCVYLISVFIMIIDFFFSGISLLKSFLFKFVERMTKKKEKENKKEDNQQEELGKDNELEGLKNRVKEEDNGIEIKMFKFRGSPENSFEKSKDQKKGKIETELMKFPKKGGKKAEKDEDLSLNPQKKKKANKKKFGKSPNKKKLKGKKKFRKNLPRPPRKIREIEKQGKKKSRTKSRSKSSKRCQTCAAAKATTECTGCLNAWDYKFVTVDKNCFKDATGWTKTDSDVSTWTCTSCEAGYSLMEPSGPLAVMLPNQVPILLLAISQLQELSLLTTRLFAKPWKLELPENPSSLVLSPPVPLLIVILVPLAKVQRNQTLLGISAKLTLEH